MRPRAVVLEGVSHLHRLQHEERLVCRNRGSPLGTEHSQNGARHLSRQCALRCHRPRARARRELWSIAGGGARRRGSAVQPPGSVPTGRRGNEDGDEVGLHQE